MEQQSNLITLRQAPVWEHIWVESSDQIPARQVPFVALNNDIHPLWRQEAFRDYVKSSRVNSSFYDSPYCSMTPEFYDRMTPVLRLVSILLRVAAPVLVRIIRAPIEQIDSTTDTHSSTWVPKEEDYHYLDQSLLELAKQLRIMRLAPTAPYSTMSGTIHGLTTVLDNDSNEEGHIPQPILVFLAAEELDEIESDLWLSKTPIQRAGLWLYLAMLLIHELAHALRMFRLQPDQTLHNNEEEEERTPFWQIPEPLVWPEEVSELGDAVVRYVFGCTFSFPAAHYRTKWDILAGVTAEEAPIRSMANGSYGVLARVHNNRAIAGASTPYAITAQSIFSMFDMNTWNRSKLTIYLLAYSTYEIKPSTVRQFSAPDEPDAPSPAITGVLQNQ